ncbi:MAG TPA: AzlD domain-containing protein [Rhodocyclaceae bacterium]|nr:AzlD domain-containing protein [Rhodocyclaceae bacterium]
MEKVWIVILALAAATFATRLSFLGLFAHVELPRLVRRALAYMPPAILAAIIMPQVFPAVAGVPSFDPARLLAAVIASLVAWKTRSTMATVSIGMLALWGLQAILG